MRVRFVVQLGLVNKSQYDTDKQNTERKIEDVDKTIWSTTGLVKKTDANEIPSTSDLVKVTDYDTKITEIENKIANISN